MVKNTLLFLLICLSLDLASQRNSTTYTAGQIAMGYQRSFGRAHQYINANPAFLYDSPDKWTLIASSEKRYFTDINGVIVGAEKQINNRSGFAFYTTDFGLKEWKENQVALNYGRQLTNRFSLGASFVMNQLRLQEYGNRTTWDISVGLGYTPSDRITLSLMIENLTPKKIEESQKSFVIVGGKYALSTNVAMSFELSSPNDHISSYRWSYALDYNFSDAVSVILGVHSDAAAPSVGVVLKIFDQVHLTVAGSKHNYLGSTAALGLSYSVN